VFCIILSSAGPIRTLFDIWNFFIVLRRLRNLFPCFLLKRRYLGRGFGLVQVAEGTVQGGYVGAVGTVVQKDLEAFGTFDQKDVGAQWGPAGTVKNVEFAQGKSLFLL